MLFDHICCLSRIRFHVVQLSIVDESKALIPNAERLPLKVVRFLAGIPASDMSEQVAILPFNRWIFQKWNQIPAFDLVDWYLCPG